MISAKPWSLISPQTLRFVDRVRLLFGTRLYVRFDSPDGHCHAACNITTFVQDAWPLVEVRPGDVDHRSWEGTTRPTEKPAGARS